MPKQPLRHIDMENFSVLVIQDIDLVKIFDDPFI